MTNYRISYCNTGFSVIAEDQPRPPQDIPSDSPRKFRVSFVLTTRQSENQIEDAYTWFDHLGGEAEMENLEITQIT